MKISNGLELIDLAIFTNRTLIMSDFHIGYEEALNKQGLMVPRFQFQEIMKRLENIFLRLKGRKIERIIVCGDLKHEFGSISDQEWRQTLKLLDYFGQYCNEIILIKGNHDTILGPIAKKRNVRVVEHYIIEPTTNHNTNKTIKKNTILKNSINNINKKVQKNIKNDTIKKITINSIAANKINIINKKNQNYDKKETFKKITMKNKLFKKISVAAKCKKNHKNKIC
jgi:putative SbcD/Mre11-related phosphoesterase